MIALDNGTLAPKNIEECFRRRHEQGGRRRGYRTEQPPQAEPSTGRCRDSGFGHRLRQLEDLLAGDDPFARGDGGAEEVEQ